MSQVTSNQLELLKEAKRLIEEGLDALRKTEKLHIIESNSKRKPRYVAVDYETYWDSLTLFSRATTKLAKAEGQTGVTVE